MYVYSNASFTSLNPAYVTFTCQQELRDSSLAFTPDVQCILLTLPSLLLLLHSTFYSRLTSWTRRAVASFSAWLFEQASSTSTSCSRCRSGSDVKSPVFGLQLAMAEGLGVAYGIERVVEGAAALAKGIYHPTLPLKATLTPIEAVGVPLAQHTVSVVKGRAYCFGGKTHGERLADNDMHVVILPSSGVESADYKRIEASAEAPPRRSGHSAAVVGDRVLIFGGCGEDGQPVEEQGKVWVFDTVSNKWSSIEPAESDAARPSARKLHAAVASEHPQPVQHRTDEGSLPQQPPDPASIVPEPPSPDTYGTLIVHGGQDKSGAPLNDLWCFDISTRTWTELPQPPTPSSQPSLALVGRRLYTFANGQTSYLDLTQSSYDDRGGAGELGLAPLGPWTSLPDPSTADHSHPGDRSGGSLVHVTTGQGRHYLVMMGGQSASGEVLDDIWALQLKPEGMTAASFKDAARQAIKKDTGEAEWEEVKYHDSEGVMIQEGQKGRGLGGRRHFAAAKGSEVDGASVVIWGGTDSSGKVLGDGLMVTVER